MSLATRPPFPTARRGEIGAAEKSRRGGGAGRIMRATGGPWREKRAADEPQN